MSGWLYRIYMHVGRCLKVLIMMRVMVMVHLQKVNTDEVMNYM